MINIRGALLLVVTLLCLGCQAQPSKDCEDRVNSLGKENSNLKERIDLLILSNTDAVNLLNDITDDLAKMTGQEAEVRALQGDLGPGIWEASSDLRDVIAKRLNTLQEELEASKEKHSELSKLTNQPEYLAFKKTISNIELLLAEKERTILELRGEMESLAQQSAELQEEVERSREENETLKQEAQERQGAFTLQEAALARMRREVGDRYFFSGTPDQIRAALNHGDIAKHIRTYRVPDYVLQADRPPRIFQTVSPEQTSIFLGYGRQVKVLSVHRHNDSLYYAACDAGECQLRLKNSFAFWSVSHYLIVEIKP